MIYINQSIISSVSPETWAKYITIVLNITIAENLIHIQINLGIFPVLHHFKYISSIIHAGLNLCGFSLKPIG